MNEQIFLHIKIFITFISKNFLLKGCISEINLKNYIIYLNENIV